MTRKKIIIVLVITLIACFIPIPTGTYKDGGTKTYTALAYKIIKWNVLISPENTYKSIDIYWFPDNFKSSNEFYNEHNFNNSSADISPANEDPILDYNNESESYSKSPTEQATLNVEIKNNTISITSIPKFCSIKVTNTSNIEYKGGHHYSIEKNDNGKWIVVNNPPTDDEGIVIKPSETITLDYIQLNPEQYSYSVGEYRVNFASGFYGYFNIEN